MKVQDLNDNDPVLSLPSSQVAAINSPVGTTIFTLFGVDYDFGENGTTGLTYQVQSNNNFEISGSTHELKNTQVLTSVIF